MRESRKFTLIAFVALILIVLFAFVRGKAEAQPLGNALSQCWGDIQSASVFNWKTFETVTLTSDQIAQVLAWDDGVKFAGTNAHPQFPADTAATFDAVTGQAIRYTMDFETASGQHYAEVRVSGDGHAYVFPFRTTSPEGSAWHGCDDLVIPARDFTSLLPKSVLHAEQEQGDSFICIPVYASYPEYIDSCGWKSSP